MWSYSLYHSSGTLPMVFFGASSSDDKSSTWANNSSLVAFVANPRAPTGKSSSTLTVPLAAFEETPLATGLRPRLPLALAPLSRGFAAALDASITAADRFPVAELEEAADFDDILVEPSSAQHCGLTDGVHEWPSKRFLKL